MLQRCRILAQTLWRIGARSLVCAAVSLGLETTLPHPEAKPESVTARIERVRAELRERAANAVAAGTAEDSRPEIAQWGNWSNWTNWSNWGNWGNGA